MDTIIKAICALLDSCGTFVEKLQANPEGAGFFVVVLVCLIVALRLRK